MGDRGKLGEDGQVYFLGREKDIIKVSGYTVAPAEVEVIGSRHPAVDKIAVIGLPDLRKGEIPKAFITLKPGYELSASQIEEWFKQSIAVYKRPVVVIRKELPLSMKGSIDKKELKAQEMKKMKNVGV